MQDSSNSMIGMLLIALAASVLGCASDGAPGPAGPAGDKGAKGAAGDKGSTGVPGDGFYEAVRYGHIMVYLDGTRPDNVAFKDTLTFRFTPSTRYSDAQINGVDADYDVDFTLARFSAMDKYSQGDAYAYLNYRTNLVEADTNRVFSIYISSDHYTSDAQYFRLDNQFDNGYNEGVNINNPVYSRYAYNPATGRLRSKFSFTSPAANNNSGHDLQVTVVIDATVYEYLGGT